MGARRFARLCALGAVAALALAPAMAQTPAKPADVSPAERAKVERAAFNFKLLLSAMQSDKIPVPVKDALFGCIYTNSLSKVTEAMDKLIAANSARINRTNPDQMIGVMAGVCGYRPQPPAATPKR